MEPPLHGNGGIADGVRESLLAGIDQPAAEVSSRYRLPPGTETAAEADPPVICMGHCIILEVVRRRSRRYPFRVFGMPFLRALPRRWRAH